MANRHGRRARLRSAPAPSSSSGTPTPGQADPLAKIIELTFTPPPEAGPTVAEIEAQWWARKNLETMGFVFPRPGEAFEELGGTVHRGTRPSLDP